MKNILVTGGTVFVSRYVAEYFVRQGHQVFVLNRNSNPQSEGVILLEGDRHSLGDKLKDYHFDAVLDITAYTREDVKSLLDALGDFSQYVFISSSAVYPETLPQPFKEEQRCGKNSIWGAYGADKLEAEQYLQEHVPNAYILRPPYLYGPMNNVYREGFVFDCADADRLFYLPGDGSMGLQFFHVEDLCRVIEGVIKEQPQEHIINVGNPDTVTIKEWVKLCYQAAGKQPEFREVSLEHAQRSYFCFHEYDYVLDVNKQHALLPGTKPLSVGLKEAYEWYKGNKDLVNRREYMAYIDEKLLGE